MEPGTIVRCRNRDWVMLPGEEELVWLRPLVGSSEEAVGIHLGLSRLIGAELSEERIRPSVFPFPSEEDVGDAAGASLLWQAARLTLREGASPFRSLGRISIRPRAYQFVPLLMALRINPVRLFIADDVGVGKTIEALLIARELYDRGEIKRLAVLCPPYLCEQWAAELEQKFNLEPVIIRSGTVSMLERLTPPGKTLYQHFPIQVISIDWVKSERNKHAFLLHCPEMVIVDEVHGAAEALERSSRQQERHQLLQEVAKKENRHLILLTATPHSGIEETFRSLLGLLKPKFREWDFSHLQEDQRAELARHFIQRTRKDIEKSWESEGSFPQRETMDVTHSLSPLYFELFEKTHKFCSEIVRMGAQMEGWKQRVRYWGALALLRCVMSSPAAAKAALEGRLKSGQALEEEEVEYSSAVFEPDTEERLKSGQVPKEAEVEYTSAVFESDAEMTLDETPTPPIEAAERTLPPNEQRKLRELRKLAERIVREQQDTKVSRCAEVIKGLLQAGFYPIIWCRYVATAEYVGEYLRQALGGGQAEVQVVVITGRIGDDERRIKIAEVDAKRPRVLVATDCLSEGINLQDKFTAVLHYDLPWNPNRMEQREGRVDRYGQPAKSVKAIRFYGQDNPVDGVVLRVLLDKAREIHRTLGTHVPVPEESETVMQAILNALFLRQGRVEFGQPQLFELEEVQAFHQQWDRDVKRERENRARFAQSAIKPEEVLRELEATDSVLGSPEAVQEFVLNAAQRIGLTIQKDPRQGRVFRISRPSERDSHIPEAIRSAVSSSKDKDSVWFVSFVSPAPEGAEYLGRNHRFVAALAHYLLEEALSQHGQAIATRCGVIRTRAVRSLTTLMLLRVRYLMRQPEKPPLLAEEVVVLGYLEGPSTAHPSAGEAKPIQWLPPEEALSLLTKAKPDANIPLAEKRELLRRALDQLGQWTPQNAPWGQEHPLQEGIRERLLERASALAESHQRIRKGANLPTPPFTIQPHLPPDLLGVLVLQPVIEL